MLAQSFKTAADLGISDLEHFYLTKVLGMLERGDLVDVEAAIHGCTNGFNMGTQGKGCGTPACIGGWVAFLMGEDQMTYVDRFLQSRTKNQALTELYWNERAVEKGKVAHAAVALRSYLTTGDARWDLALGQ